MAAGYKVTAPLVAVPVGEQVLQFANGDVLPGGISSDAIKHLSGLGFIAEVKDESAPVGYDAQSKADLEAEIEKRNADRSDDSKIVVDGKGNKHDLVAALVVDDSK